MAPPISFLLNHQCYGRVACAGTINSDSHALGYLLLIEPGMIVKFLINSVKHGPVSDSISLLSRATIGHSVDVFICQIATCWTFSQQQMRVCLQACVLLYESVGSPSK